MTVVKWILLIGLIALTIWLVVDTTIYVVKKVKKKKLAKKSHDNFIDNNDKQ